MAYLRYRDENGRVTAVELRDSIVRIGRQPDCELWIQQPFVGRRHAQIELRGDQWWLVDLDSVHGTCVNGKQVEESALQEGDEILVGGTERVTLETGAAPEHEKRVSVAAAPAGAGDPTGGLVLTRVEILKERPIAGAGDAGIVRQVREAVQAADLESACRAVLGLAMSLTGAERGVIVRREDPEFRPVVHRVGAAEKTFDAPVSPELAQRLVSEAVAILARDSGALAAMASGVKGGSRTFVAAPIIDRAGYLFLDSAGDGLTEAHLDVACCIVAEAGPGLSRPRFARR